MWIITADQYKILHFVEAEVIQQFDGNWNAELGDGCITPYIVNTSECANWNGVMRITLHC